MGNQCCNNLTSRIKDVNLNNDIINRMKQKYNNIKSDTIGYNCDYDEDNIDIFDKGIDCGTKKCINQNININSSSNNNDELENLDFNNFFSKSNDRNSITKLKIKNNKDKHSSNNKTEGDPYNINKLIHTKITSFNDTMTNFNNICSNLNCSIACKNNCKEIASYIDINKLSCIENIDYLIDITKDNYNFSNDITNNNITSNNNNNRNTNKTMYREAYKVKNLNLNSKLLSGFLSDSSSHSTNCFMSNLSKNTINNFKYNENCVHCAFNNTQFNNRNKKNKIEDKDTNDDNDNEMNFNANIDNEFIRKLIDNNSHSNNNHNNTSNYNDNITKYENFNKNLNKIKLNVVYKKKSSNQNSNNGNDDISNKYNYKNDKHSLYENRNFTHESITLDKYKERINNVNHLKGISNSNFINLSNSTNKNSYTLRRKRMYSNSVSFVNSHIMKTSNNKYNPNIMNNNNLYCIDSTREIINKFNKQNFIRHIINSNMNIAKECYSSNQRGINPYKANKLTKNYSYDNILIRDYKSYLCVEVINKENNKSDIKRIKSNKNNNSNIAITKPQFAYVITDKGEVFNISTDCDFLKNNYNNYVQDNDICFYDSFNSNFPVTIGSDKNSRIFINDTSENLNSLNYISVSFFKNQYIIKFLCCINMKVLDNVELNKKNTILFHCCKIDIEIEETKRKVSIIINIDYYFYLLITVLLYFRR